MEIKAELDKFLKETKTHQMICNNTFYEDVLNSWVHLHNQFNLTHEETTAFLIGWITEILESAQKRMERNNGNKD